MKNITKQELFIINYKKTGLIISLIIFILFAALPISGFTSPTKRSIAGAGINLAKKKPAPKHVPQVKPAKPARPDVLEGVDYSWGYYSGLPTKIKQSKKHFVMRYTNTGEGKEITAAEVKELKQAGIGIGIVHQITRKDYRPLEGFKAGQADARTARQSVHDAGLPTNTPVYFSVDFDVNQAQQQKINQYFKGVASILGKDRVGVYGGYFTVARALNAGVVKYAWQTYSWSKGKWDPRAQIRQYKNSLRQHGIPVDLDKTIHRDNGIQY